jgi:hypothetical protein
MRLGRLLATSSFWFDFSLVDAGSSDFFPVVRFE